MGIIQMMLGRGTVWTPARLFAAGEQGVWYDPSDLSSLFQDAAGTTPVTAVEQPVGRILDKSGRGNHATQTVGAARPILRQDAGGHLHLAFDGVDDGVVTAAINFTVTNKITACAGVHKAAGTGFQGMVELGTGTTENEFGLFGPSAAGPDYDFRLQGTACQTSATYAPPITNVLSAVFDLAQTTALAQRSARINGITPTFAATQAAVSGGTFVNGALHLGQRSGGALPFNGRIYQLIVRGSASTTQEIADAERFVAQKTGITL